MIGRASEIVRLWPLLGLAVILAACDTVVTVANSPTTGGGCGRGNPTTPQSCDNPAFADLGGYQAGHSPNSIAAADFNGDGLLDVVVANYSDDDTVSVFLNLDGGTFSSQTAYAVGTQPRWVTVGDFNGDCLPDLAVANWASSTVGILLNAGNGRFAAQVTYPVGTNPSSLAAGDLDGDGKLDLVVTNWTLGVGTVSVLLNQGLGTFAPQVTYPIGTAPNSVSLADFNGDGKLDIATSNGATLQSTSNTVSLLLNNGDGTFGLQANYAAGRNPEGTVAADFDGDGKLDLAVANADDKTVGIFINLGEGVFSPQVAFATGATGYTANNLVTADFNGDGLPDLATANEHDSTVSVLLNLGDGGFAPQVVYAAGGGAMALVSGDFSGGGTLDLVTANQQAASISPLQRSCN